MTAAANLASTGYRLVVTTRTQLPPGLLDDAIEAAAGDGARVHVVLPFVLPAQLPFSAAPPRLVKRVKEQERNARETLQRIHVDGRVDVLTCRSERRLLATLCAAHPPAEIIVAGPAPWSLRRALHGVAPMTVFSDRGRHRHDPHPSHRTAFE